VFTYHSTSGALCIQDGTKCGDRSRIPWDRERDLTTHTYHPRWNRRSWGQTGGSVM